jgi:3-carboxy-cis,cis-muconate cycloisomerase
MTMPETDGNRLFDPLMLDERCAALLSDRAFVRRMLEVEAALARAQGLAGVIPPEAGRAINRAVDTVHQDELHAIASTVAEGAARAGTPVIPLVKLLTARTDPEGQPFVHWGATTQDVMDTALMLQLRDVLAVIDDGLLELADALAALAEAHRMTPMAARTVMQQALPTTFGLKAAGWLGAVTRHRQRLAEARPRLLVLQFGGAAGTLASLGDKGGEVAERLAAELGLGTAPPWHGARDRVGEVAALCGLICGTLGKIGHDVALMMQTEIQEAFEPAAPGRGGSSAMPHKRNPVLAAVMTGAGIAAPGLVATILAAQMHEHERAAGHAHAEWRTLPELLKLTGGALKAGVALAQGLDVRPERMRHNLGATNGLIMAEAVMMALGAKIGRLEAHHLVEEACRRAIAEDRPLLDVLVETRPVLTHLGRMKLEALMRPESYLGSAALFIDQALADHAALRAGAAKLEAGR